MRSTLIKCFTRIDSEGRVLFPNNVQKALGLKKNQLLELKIVGTSRKRNLLISKRETAR